jgi:hypothetical protein
LEAKVACGQPSSAESFGQGDVLEQLGDLERFGVGIGLDEDAAVRAHGQGRADRLLGLDRADGDRDDLLDDALFLQPHPLLDGNLAKGIHRHLDVGQVDARLVGSHARLDVGIDRPLYRNQDLHALTVSSRRAP